MAVLNLMDRMRMEAGFPPLKRQNKDGGPGSGNFGHAGVPGQVGGSAPSLSSDEMDAVAYWKGGMDGFGYANIRAVVNGREAPAVRELKNNGLTERSEELRRKLDKLSKDFQSAIKKAPTADGKDQIRVTGSYVIPGVGKPEIGAEFTLEALTSFSTAPDDSREEIVRKFGAEGQIVFHMRGTTDFRDISKIADTVGGTGNEAEVVSEKPMRYRVTGIEERNYGGEYVDWLGKWSGGVNVQLVTIEPIADHTDGGPGSGNHGHSGVPGQVGVSAPGNGSRAVVNGSDISNSYSGKPDINSVMEAQGFTGWVSTGMSDGNSSKNSLDSTGVCDTINTRHSDGRFPEDDTIIRTADNGKKYAINTSTGQTSGLGPDVDKSTSSESQPPIKHQKPTKFTRQGTELTVDKNTRIKIGNNGKTVMLAGKLTDIEDFAGTPDTKPLEKEPEIISVYGGKAGEWIHSKGIGSIRRSDGTVQKAEIHWIEHPTIGQIAWKVKKFVKE